MIDIRTASGKLRAVAALLGDDMANERRTLVEVANRVAQIDPAMFEEFVGGGDSPLAPSAPTAADMAAQQPQAAQGQGIPGITDADRMPQKYFDIIISGVSAASPDAAAEISEALAEQLRENGHKFAVRGPITNSKIVPEQK